MAFSIFAAGDPALSPRFDDLELAVSQVRTAEIFDPATVQAQAEVLAFCADHRDALHRSCLTGHLTGSALVISATADQTLLLHHTKLDRWLQPGGHADGDGNLAGVALKEATEETGIEGLRVVTPAVDIDIHVIPERGDVPEHRHHDVRFVVLAPPGARVDHNEEAIDFRWVSGDDPVLSESSELLRSVTRALAVAVTLDRR